VRPWRLADEYMPAGTAANLLLSPWLVGVRRVFIVEAGSKRVEGIISLRDIFKFLLSL
jgi:hypothetical protein